LSLGSFSGYDFDSGIDRGGTASLKYDGRQNMFGREDVIPLWVADMDFAVPAAVSRALSQRAAHPVYGYTLYPDSLYQCLIDGYGGVMAGKCGVIGS
jgi:cystathionine beta-lyase